MPGLLGTIEDAVTLAIFGPQLGSRRSSAPRAGYWLVRSGTLVAAEDNDAAHAAIDIAAAIAPQKTSDIVARVRTTGDMSGVLLRLRRQLST